MQVSADILLVIATIVAIISISSIVASWTVRRWPWAPLLSLCIAGGLLIYVHVNAPEGLAPVDIPDAFIAVAARILN